MPITEEVFKKRIAENLVKYRKAAGLTQLELAERLNYSDKSVSKWERGDAVPDLYVLMQMAELYQVSMDELLSDVPAAKPAIPKKRRRVVSTLMSVGVVWLVATVLFFIAQFFDITWAWLAFIYAIPVSAIVLIVFSSLWAGRLEAFLSRSLLYWGIALALHLSLKALLPPINLIYIVTAAAEGVDFIWLFRKPVVNLPTRKGKSKKEKNKKV